MTGSPAEFVVQVDEWIAKAKEAPMLVVKETIQDINNAIVEETPVITGFLRGSYYGAINQPPVGPAGAARGSAAFNAVLADLNAGDTYFFGNTAAYARRVELGFVGTDSLGRVYNQRGRFYMTGVLSRASAIAMAAAERVAQRLKG